MNNRASLHLHCLHGFLGSSSDWRGVLSAEVQPFLYDLFSPLLENRVPSGLIPLGHWVNSHAQISSSPRVLLGYSLGGRIALHALLQSPSLWSAAIIVSAHPGLVHPQEREVRLKADQAWAKRFQEDEWEKVVKDWNSQAVFSGGKVSPPKKSSDFSRAVLVASLNECSLGRQQDLRSELQKIKIPILWISGAEDAKFCSVAEEMTTLNSNFEWVCVPGAGHRVPWDDPQLFGQTVSDFLLKINSKTLKGI